MIKEPKLSAVKSAVGICAIDMQTGLTACERILETDNEVIEHIIRRSAQEVRNG